MIGTLIWLVGVVCTIWCVLDIFKKNISTAGKVIASVLVFLLRKSGAMNAMERLAEKG